MYSVSASDSSSQAINPLAGLLSGGFSFSTAKVYGGTGSSLTSNPSANATLTPTQSNSTAPGAMSPLTPFADGLLGFGGSGPAGAGSSLLVPAILLGGFLLLAVAIKAK
jgi:hypothetical protein